MGVQSYRDLVAWQKAMDMVEAVYRATQTWPKDEVYGLTTQARRAAVSVPANIAEGQGRRGAAEMVHHLSMAGGSLHELETHLLIALRLGYTTRQHSRPYWHRRMRSAGCSVDSYAACADGLPPTAYRLPPIPHRLSPSGCPHLP
jgi:four helix bundle protein